MQNQLMLNNFQGGATIIRNNLNVVASMNKKIKEDTDEYKRRLSMSNSNSSLKLNSNNSLRSNQINELIENNQNWVNSQHTAKSNASFSKITQGQPKVLVTSAESSVDIVSRLSAELSQANKQIFNLKRIIVKNDDSARTDLANLQAALNKSQEENQQLRIQLKQSLRELQQRRNIPQQTDCLRCPDLQNKIRDLQQKLLKCQALLREKVGENFKYEKENKLLKYNISELQQQLKNSLQEYDRLAKQLGQKLTEIQQIQIVVQNKDRLLQQLQSKLSQIQEYRAQIQGDNAQKEALLRQNQNQLNQKQAELAHISQAREQLLKQNQQLDYNLKNIMEQNQQLHHSLRDLRLQNEQLDNSFQDLGRQNDTLEHSLRDIHQQNEQLNNSIRDLLREKQNLILKADRSEQTVTVLSQTLAFKESQIEDMSKYIDQLNQQIQQANQRAAKSEALASSLAQIQKQLSKRQLYSVQSSQQLVNNLNVLAQSNKNLKQENQGLILKLEKFEKQFRNLQQHNSRLERQIADKNNQIEDVIAHPILPRQQQEYIQSILKQNQDKLNYIAELTQQLLQQEQKAIIQAKQKEQLYNGIRQLEINHRNVIEEAAFYKNKLEEAQDYIAQLNKQKNELIGRIQQLQSYIQQKQTDKITQAAQINLQNAQLRQDFQALLRDLQYLKEEKNVVDFKCRDIQGLNKALEIQLNRLQALLKHNSQQIELLNKEKIRNDQNANKDHILLQRMKLQIQQLNQKLSQAQKYNNTEPISDQSLRSLKKKVAQLQTVITELTNQANFFKSQLIHVQKFIQKLLRQSGDNEHIRESIRMLEKDMQMSLGQPKNEPLADQFQDTHKKQIETKLNQVKDNELLLNEFKNKVQEAERQIARLQSQNVEALRKAQQADRQLNEINEQVEFLRLKLAQAEGYINYIQSLKSNEVKVQNSSELAQLSKLRQELLALQQQNRQLTLQKNVAQEALEHNLGRIKNLEEMLVLEKGKLREAQGYIAQMQNQREKIESERIQLRLLLEQANRQVGIYKDRLQQLQDQVNFLKNKQYRGLQEQQRNQLLNRLKALEQQKYLLEELRQNSAIESKNRQDLLKSLQKSVLELNKRVLQADGRVNKFDQQQKILEERARNAVPLEDRLKEAVFQIEQLQKQVQYLKSQLNGYKDRQINLISKEKQLQNRTELQYFKNKLIEAENYITMNQNQNNQLHQTVNNLQLQILNLQREKKKLQSKILPENKLEQLKAESDFFKMKLLLAEQYITQLQKRTGMGQESIIVSVSQGLNQNNARNSVYYVNNILGQLQETRRQLQISQVNANLIDQHYKQAIKNLQQKLSASVGEKEQSQNSQIIEDAKYRDSLSQIQTLKRRILEGQSYIAELQNVIVKVNDKVKKLEDEVAQLKQDKVQTADMLRRVQDNRAELKQQNDNVKLKVQNLQYSLINLSSQHKQIVQKAQYYQQEVEKLINNIARLQEQLFDSLSQKQKIQNINKQLVSQNDKLKAEIQTQITAAIQRAIKNQPKLQLTPTEEQHPILELHTAQQIQKQDREIHKIDEDSAQFFKGKLKEAEVYITYLQQENQNYENTLLVLNSQIEELKKELSAQNSLSKNNLDKEPLTSSKQELSHWDQHVNSLKLKQSRSGETLSHLKPIQIINNKLQNQNEIRVLQAKQEQLSILQGSISKLQNQNIELKKELASLYEQAQNLRQALLHYYSSQTAQNQQIFKQNQILRDAILQHQSKIQQTQSQNKKISVQMQICKKQIEELKDQLKLKEVYINDLQLTKKREVYLNQGSTSDRFNQSVSDQREKVIKNIYQIDIGSKNKLRMKDYQQGQHKLRSPIQDTHQEQEAEFFKYKLHEAEVHISELQDQNESINKAIEALQQQVKVLKSEVNNLNEKLLICDSQKGIYQQKSYKLSESLTLQIARISYLQQKIKNLQEELKYRNDKGQQQVDRVQQRYILLNQKHEKIQQQIQILKNQNYGLKRQLQIQQIEQAHSIEQLTALQQLLQTKQKEIDELKRQIQPTQQLSSNKYSKVLEKVNINTEESQTSIKREEQLGQTVLKIIEMTKSYTQDMQPQQNFGELDSFPYLNELIQSIIYRLKLASALDIQKTIKINKLIKELELANSRNNQAEVSKLSIDELRRQKEQVQINNQQVTGELSMYREINHQLINQLSYITEELDLYKLKIDYYERKVNQNSRQESDPSGSSNQFYLQFLNSCLKAVVSVQDQINQIETQIEHISRVQQISKQMEYAIDDSLSGSSRDDLLREIDSLNNAVEIYHQESTRRQKQYKMSIENLLQDLCALKYLYDQFSQQKDNDQITDGISQLGLKMKAILDKDQNQIRQQVRNNQQQIVRPSPYRQIIKMKNQKIYSLNPQKRVNEHLSFSEVAIQTDEDTKPFLNYVLNVRDLDKEDILLLKKKISSMRSKQIQDNMQILQQQEEKIQQILIQNNIQSTPKEIENIILTLAHNLSSEQIGDIFASQDSDQIVRRINQALNIEDSYLRGLNPTIVIQQIQERMMLYYEKPTKLSEVMHSYLINMLLAKTQLDLYNIIQGFFRDLSEIQNEFEAALNKKDQVYRLHNEKMNKIFTRSMSDLSEDEIRAFEAHAQEIEPTAIQQTDPDNSSFTAREREQL